MSKAEMEAVIEAILFTMGDSVEVSRIAKVIEQDTETTKKLIHNMISVFAKKAYFLNRRLQIMSCSTLRQKLAKTILTHYSDHPDQPFSMSQTDLSEFLNVARPSISRELNHMKEEGLIDMKKRKITVPDPERLIELL